MEWGFLLKKLFGIHLGSHLGTGDYGHLVIDHSVMFLQHISARFTSTQVNDLSHPTSSIASYTPGQQTMMPLDLASLVSKLRKPFLFENHIMKN